MKFFLLFLILILFVTQSNAQSFLRADGKRIVNESDEKIILRGMGLGGWMLQEGYMLKLGNLGQQHVIKGKIEELIGPEKTKEFYEAWLANHVRKEDIDAMAKWGFNSVRLPMHYNLYTLPVEQEPVAGKNTWLETGFKLTDELLAWCKANNIYLILDLHAAPGGQGNDHAISDRDPSKPSLWDSKANQEKTVALWRKLAERYKDEPMIAGYDIINEPNWGFENPEDKNGCQEKSNKPLKKFLMDVTSAIREVDSTHIIFVEGNCWGNNYNGIMPLWDSNMVVSFHKYWNHNTQESIKTHLDLREKYNVPIWLGESGENSNVWFRDSIKLVENNQIGWAFWPLKKIGFNNPLEVKANKDYFKLVEYWNGRAEKPSSQFAYKALMTLANKDILFENSDKHVDVIDAMLVQPHNDATRPFKPQVILRKGGQVLAVDYDLGTNGVAYFDVDYANYHVSTGKERSLWNDGLQYRNDGVDIGYDEKAKSYYVNKIETGEWLQYSLDLEAGGNYLVKVTYSSLSEGAKINLSVNNGPTNVVALSQTGKEHVWKTTDLQQATLLKGANTIRIGAVAGGYNLSDIQFIRLK